MSDILPTDRSDLLDLLDIELRDVATTGNTGQILRILQALIGLGGGGVGFTLGDPQNVFVADTQANAEALRDAYATANPAWLASYNADTSLNIRVEYTNSSGNPVAVYMVRNDAGDTWLENESFEALRGFPGQNGQLGLSGVSDRFVPFNDNGALADSPMRVLADGTAFIEGITRIEAGTLAVGSFIQISERGGFLGLTNALGDEFTLVDYRTPRDAPSGRPRILFYTEAENALELQTDVTATLTSPVAFNYTPATLSRSNSFIGQVSDSITNLRFRILDVSTGSVLKYFPSEADYRDGVGVDFTPGAMTLSFGDTELPLSVGREIRVEILFDSGSLLGNGAGFPALTAMIQRGEFRDLAYLSEVAHPSIHNFRINEPSRVDLNTDLNTATTVTFDLSNYSLLTALDLVVTGGDDVALTLPIADGDQTQTVTLSGIDTSTATTITFALRGTYSGGTYTSNTHTLEVRNLGAHELTYLNAQTDRDPANFTTTGANSGEYQTQQTLAIPTFANTAYIVIGQPQTEPDITSIMIGGLEQISTFEKVSGTATVGGETFEFWYSRNPLLGSVVSGTEVTVARG